MSNADVHAVDFEQYHDDLQLRSERAGRIGHLPAVHAVGKADVDDEEVIEVPD